jgi:hypothetical protein
MGWRQRSRTPADGRACPTGPCGAGGGRADHLATRPASRPGAPGARSTAGHLRVTEPVRGAQRRTLRGLLAGYADRARRSPQGQRVRRRWRDAHPGRWSKARTGRRALDIRRCMGCWPGPHEAVVTAQDIGSPMVGTPDAWQRTCPGWGGLGGHLRYNSKAPSFYSISCLAPASGSA